MQTKRRLSLPVHDFRPAYVVWELTLKCDQPCTHCGSRAGDARANELSTDEAVRVAKELAAMRADEVVLIGGEAYLHPGVLTIVKVLAEGGVRPAMTTGGRGVTESLARDLALAGLVSVSVSIDGLEATHDTMRAAKGSFASATRAIAHFKAAGVRVAANTNLNRYNQRDLEGLYEHLSAQGICAWQVQLTTPLGRAADRPEMIAQPYDLLDLLPRIAALKERAFEDGILIMPGNNLGYFGPEEALLRSLTREGRDHFAGCQAGKYVLGIESDGAVKGCPSLQTSHYVGGNLRESALKDIWTESPTLGFARVRSVDSLWGFCRTCPFAETCMGGCTFTAHAFFGRPGNNPYCHFRARTLKEAGMRERLVLRSAAPGEPFDHAVFDLLVEPWDSPEPAAPEHASQLLKIRRHPARASTPDQCADAPAGRSSDRSR
jgi:radical SAM protein with 4Fe4S-binding SPASM domain